MEGQGQGRLTQCDLTNVDYVVSSQRKQDTFAFVWTLADFNSFLVEKELPSPLFHGGPKTNHTWQLIVQPKGLHYEPTEYSDKHPLKSFSVRLRLNEFGKEFKGGPGSILNASFQTSLLDKDNKTVFQQGSPVAFFPFELMKPSNRQDLVVCWIDPDFEGDYTDYDASREFDAKMNQALVNGALKLHCRIWIQYTVEHVSSSLGPNFEEVKEAKLRRLENLASDLQWGTETTSSTYTDVSIVTKTATLRANKFILAARSPVFRTMFQSPLFCAGDTTAEAVVKIDEFDADDVLSMLEYMYTGATPVQSEKAMELFQVGDYYGLDGLKEASLDVMVNDVTVTSAVTTLTLAQLHNYPKLKTKVLNFMNRNKTEILESEEFKEFAKLNPDVVLELYSS